MSATLLTTLIAVLAGAEPPAVAAPPPPPPPAAVAAKAEGETSPSVVDPSGQWRGARWGMTVEEVQRAFPGEIRKVEPPLKLPNGTTVELRIDGQQLLGHPLRAAFVFEGGKLAMVSLRTPENHFAPAAAYDDAAKLLRARLGAPRDESADANFIDMRQTTWVLPSGRLDLKFIPGVLVLLYHPT